MAWTALPTYSDGDALTAAQMLAIAANLNETAPAKATTEGGFFVVSNTNEIEQREMGFQSIATSESTSSGSFTDLTTVGPTVTIPSTGPRAIVIVTGSLSCSTAGGSSFMCYEISGASTFPPADTVGIRFSSGAVSEIGTHSSVQIAGITSGSNTFQAKYRSSNTSTYGSRRLGVLAF